MTKETTETGRSLIPEGHYEATILKVRRKEVREFIIYEWSFESLVDNKQFNFSISLFSSQISELLKSLGAKEITSSKFEWDMEDVVGNTLEFNIGHVPDKKGVIREQLADIKLLTKNINPDGVKTPEEIIWDEK